jgi:hypothetical protein
MAMGVEMARLRQGARLGFVEYAVIMLLLAFVIGLILLPYWLRG